MNIFETLNRMNIVETLNKGKYLRSILNVSEAFGVMVWSSS